MRERDPWVPMTARIKPRLRLFRGVWHCESVDGCGEILRAKGATVREAYGHWRFADWRFADRIHSTSPLFERLFGKAKRNT
jgi:hypothetical protein